MKITLSLPNKQGNYKPVVIPKYILEILLQRRKDKFYPRIYEIGCYQYRIYGYNPQRPAYGIHDDINKLKKWVEQYSSTIENVRFIEVRKNYFVDFDMYDPIVQQLEKNNLILKMGDTISSIKINNED